MMDNHLGTRRVCSSDGIKCVNCYHYGIRCINCQWFQDDVETTTMTYEEFREGSSLIDLPDNYYEYSLIYQDDYEPEGW